MKKGGGIGMVVLVVVLAVVLILVARQWQTIAPTALQLDGDTPMVTPATGGEVEAGQALQKGGLPDLNQMRQATGTHADRVQQALSETE